MNDPAAAITASPRRSRRTPSTSTTRSLLIATTIAVALAHISGAQAATGDLTCEGSGQLNLSPALTATNHNAIVSLTAGLVNCTSVNGRYPQLRSDAAIGTGTATSAPGVNPCGLLVSLATSDRVTWSPTGEHSTSTALLNTDPSNGTVAISSHFTGGVLAGDSGTFVATATPNLDCALNGLTSLTLNAGQVLIG